MKKIILIIEDNDAIRENTAELLELSNYEVYTADNGSSGFELTKKLRPDLILCDMLMPETDGYKFLMLFKEDDQVFEIPLIFFSAGSVPSPFWKHSPGTCDDFLRKPFTEEELLQAVEKKLRKQVDGGTPGRQTRVDELL